LTNRRDIAGHRYDLFGWDYEAINPLGDAEVQWYLRWAATIGGPILELACGSSRLLCRLAEAGHEVAGVDLSETMLGIARCNIRSLPDKIQSRIHLLKADMSRFDLNQQFGLVVIADNSFRELQSRRQLRQCLRSIRHHLRQDGRLLITERRFRPEWYPNGVRSFGWSQPKPDPDTSDSVRRRGAIRLHKNGKRLSGGFVYEVTHSNGTTRTVQCPISAPVLDMREYSALFAESGYSMDVFQDYDTNAAKGNAQMWCFVCTPARSVRTVRHPGASLA